MHGAGNADYGRECVAVQRDARGGDLSHAGGGGGGDSGGCDEGCASRVFSGHGDADLSMQHRRGPSMRTHREPIALKAIRVFGICQRSVGKLVGSSHRSWTSRMRPSCTKCLAELADAACSAPRRDIRDGGIAVALAEALVCANGSRSGSANWSFPVAACIPWSRSYLANLLAGDCHCHGGVGSQFEETLFGNLRRCGVCHVSRIRDKFGIRFAAGVASDVRAERSSILSQLQSFEAGWSDALESQLAEEVMA